MSRTVALTWKVLPSPPDRPTLARAGHSSTLVDDDVYIISGRVNKMLHLPDMLKYNITTQTWQILSELPFSPRAHHSAALLGREIWVVGGMAAERMCDDVQAYNVDTCKWRKVDVRCQGDDKLLRRTGHACAQHPLIPDWLLIHGGVDKGQRFLDDLLILESDTHVVRRVVSKGQRPLPRAYHTFTALGNLVYLFSGRIGQGKLSQDLEVYSPELNEWLSPAPVRGVPPPGRSSHRAVALKDRIVVHGGCLKDGRRINDINTLCVSRKGRAPLTKAPLSVGLEWTRQDQPADQSALPSPRAAFAMEVLDETLYIFGGYNGETKHYPSDAWALPLGTGQVAAGRAGRGGAAAAGRGTKRRVPIEELASDSKTEWRCKKRQFAGSGPLQDSSPLPRVLPAAPAKAKAQDAQEAVPRLQLEVLPAPAAIQDEERVVVLEQQIHDYRRREREHSAQALEHRNALQHERDLVEELRRRVAGQEAELLQERDRGKEQVNSLQQQTRDWILRHEKTVVQLQAAEAASVAQGSELIQVKQQAAEFRAAAQQAAGAVLELEVELKKAKAEQQHEREAATDAVSRKQAELDAAMTSVLQLRGQLLAAQNDSQKEKQALEQERLAHQGTHAQVQKLHGDCMKEQAAAIAAREAIREEQRAGKAALQEVQLRLDQLQTEKDDMEYRLGQQKTNLDHAKEQCKKWQTNANAAEQKLTDLESDHQWLKDRCLDYEKVTRVIANRFHKN